MPHILFAHRFWWKGVKDSLRIDIPVKLLINNRLVLKLVTQCALLNGVIFVGSILLFNYGFLPASHYLYKTVYGSSEDDIAEMIQSMDILLEGLYKFLWLWPVYIMSFVLNSVWYAERHYDYAKLLFLTSLIRYQEIGDLSFQYQHKSPKMGNKKDASYESFVGNLADEIYRMLLFSVYTLQALAVWLIPWIGPFLSVIHLCWIYSFYSFDYKRMNQGWSLARRLDYLENHWAYFLGFGTPCTLASIFFQQFISAGVYALIFPLVMLMANDAKPLAAKNRETVLPKRVSIFYFAKAANNAALKLLNRVKMG